jgi:hypothetical protein
MDNQRTDQKGDGIHAAKRSRLTTAMVAIPIVAIVLIYGPLVAHLTEGKFFGSHHVADVCKSIGVQAALEFIYSNTPGIGR